MRETVGAEAVIAAAGRETRDADGAQGSMRRRAVVARIAAVGSAPLLLVADLAIEYTGVDLEHLAKSPASVAPELEDPQVMRL